MSLFNWPAPWAPPQVTPGPPVVSAPPAPTIGLTEQDVDMAIACQGDIDYYVPGVGVSTGKIQAWFSRSQGQVRFAIPGSGWRGSSSAPGHITQIGVVSISRLSFTPPQVTPLTISPAEAFAYANAGRQVTVKNHKLIPDGTKGRVFGFNPVVSYGHEEKIIIEIHNQVFNKLTGKKNLGWPLNANSEIILVVPERYVDVYYLYVGIYFLEFVTETSKSKFPHRCTKCQQPSFNMLQLVECSNSSCTMYVQDARGAE